ncbi:MAG: patatin-like phospholipase family protein, partial [Pseudomonadota bacterium]
MTDFALALGAGGARGIAHIHAIKALDDLGVRPSVIAGTSIGALMGAAYASGMSGQDIDDFIEDRIQNRLVLLSQIFRIRPESVWQFLADGGPRIGELNLERILSVFLPDTICKEFSSLSIPLRVIATDFSGERDRSFEEGPLLSALAASASIPAVFLPVKIEGFYFIDGSATNPCPVDWVQDAADRVIAIDVAGGATVPRGEKPGKLDVLYGANQIMQRTMVDL